jgi:hypothetical protein
MIRRTDFTPAWWDGEDRLATELMDEAVQSLGREAVGRRLAGIEHAASDHLQGVASTALARAGLADAGLGKSAAGSATIAVHQAALALAAGQTGAHPFAAKFRLFQTGRWPLGVYGYTFYFL